MEKEKKTFRVKIIHEYVVEAYNEVEAESIALEKPYSESRNCYLEVERE